MSKKNRKGLSSYSINFTTTISVTLLLVLLGIVTTLSIVAHNVTDTIRENVGFDLTLADSLTTSQLTSLRQQIETAEYVASSNYISKAQAAEQWKEENGEDLIEILGVNPILDEIEVKVKSRWAYSDSIDAIVAGFKVDKRVSEVITHYDIIDSVNHNIRIVSIILLAIAATLILITFVLINNTIRLAIHSRRFLIHTMKLVGATPRFIRHPFILSNALSGLIAAFVAIFILGYGFYNVTLLEQTVISLISPIEAAVICVVIITTGVIICSLAARFATTRYIHIGYDRMF